MGWDGGALSTVLASSHCPGLRSPSPFPSPLVLPYEEMAGEGHSAALKSGHPGILAKCIWEWSGPWIMLIQEPSPALSCPLPRDRNRQEGLGSTHHLVQRATENRHEESTRFTSCAPKDPLGSRGYGLEPLS